MSAAQTRLEQYQQVQFLAREFDGARHEDKHELVKLYREVAAFAESRLVLKPKELKIIAVVIRALQLLNRTAHGTAIKSAKQRVRELTAAIEHLRAIPEAYRDKRDAHRIETLEREKELALCETDAAQSHKNGKEDAIREAHRTIAACFARRAELDEVGRINGKYAAFAKELLGLYGFAVAHAATLTAKTTPSIDECLHGEAFSFYFWLGISGGAND
ncbi:hypothetical protein FACS1894103_1640 [Campylobacterota bacterium]|nr:hypothetical protein FACS1894103_1640 [Campylobacterota bacterium]